MKTLLLFCFNLLLFQNFIMYAQWSSDPATNLTICDLNGDQALSKIASTLDGGTYISWFDIRSGSYSVYLQRLDFAGNKMWDENGLLISDNPQSSSLVDYDLICDNDDNAVVVFTDTRNSGNLNVFAYRISPEGTFLWGENGIGLSDNSTFDANPKVIQNGDGNFIFVWIKTDNGYELGLQKLSPEGSKLWGEDPIILSSQTFGLSNPALVPSPGNSAVLFHTVVAGNFPAQTVKLAAKKINSSGAVDWDIMIQDIGTIAPFSVPEVISDNVGGGLIAWHDDRDGNNLQSGFVQRVDGDGNIYFPVNGAEASLLADRHKFNPVIAFDNTSEETYAFWLETEPDQNQNGISGQKLSQTGNRLWSDNAKVFKPLSAPFTLSISSLNTQMGNQIAYLFYIQGDLTGNNDKVEGFACDADGGFLWPGDFVVLSNPAPDKMQMVSTVDPYNNCKLSWGDGRGTNPMGIFAQDINPFGELGDSYIPVELTSFTAAIVGDDAVLNWRTATETNNYGFEVERQNSEESWENVGFVGGGGTTAIPQEYSFTDRLIFSVNIFYRLKQIDFDGSYEYSNVVEVENINPTKFALHQNHPNPFNPSTVISYQLAVNSKVSLKIYDVLGREVAVLEKEYQPAGNYKVEFNAKGLSSGVYYYHLEAGSYSQTKKMILMR
ncbi:MAG: T9SS type A sorting domain-containing protein [Melioribacteraceae bacterium]|nr:T9SS type A sorting domain-containing protein [Melioribacteraceae bacterium]